MIFIRPPGHKNGTLLPSGGDMTWSFPNIKACLLLLSYLILNLAEADNLLAKSPLPPQPHYE